MSASRQLLAITIREEQDVVLARQRARQIAALLGFDLQNQTKIGTAVSEIVRNAFRYAGGGKVVFALEDDGARLLAFRVSDQGPGIADLAAILAGRYDSPTGMGIGLIGTRRLMDRFDIASAAGAGTTVTFAKQLPPRAPDLTPELLGRIATALASGIPGDPVSEIQQQNQELLRVLGELQQRQREILDINQELEATNRGVVALYAELDSRADFLRRATDIKSRFLSNMTHEFRTPLNSIIALANMLAAQADGELNPEQAKQVGFIKRAAETLSSLVNDLLDIAKVDAGKVAVKPVEFTVDDLFSTLKGMLKPLLTGSTAVGLNFILPEGPPIRLLSDEGKVSQILRNFIANALKFTERGEVRVAVEALGRERVLFSVSDTGIGIRPEDFGRIFEEFGQVDAPISARFKGTGLGLPLSKRLAGLLQGRVGVQSRPGFGSVFTLELPLRYSGGDHGSLVDPGAQRETCKRQVLVIDDDDISRYLLKGLLPSSFEVAEAASGADGLVAARTLLPDAVFLDLNLPKVSGYDVLAGLKADPGIGHIPVIVYSAHAMDEEVIRRLAPANAILSMKAGDVRTAAAAVRQALEQVGLLADTGVAG